MILVYLINKWMISDNNIKRFLNKMDDSKLSLISLIITLDLTNINLNISN